jgi:hypothetical protein
MLASHRAKKRLAVKQFSAKLETVGPEKQTDAQAEERSRLVSLGKEIAERIGCNPGTVSEDRLANLARAYELRADNSTLRKIFRAHRVSRREEYELPREGVFWNAERIRVGTEIWTIADRKWGSP